MVFIVQGRIKTSQNLSKGVVATSTLGPGGYVGDELLSWCLRRPFINRVPTCSATFTCIEPTEAFGLDANHLRYVTDHFRYKFVDERLKRTVRYYSANWRTWAAVNIQLAWRRYVVRIRRAVNPVTEEDDGSNRMLRQYATIFMSFRPHDHLE
ncbi:putative rmlC-like jelly roll, cyclic nucleotide-binding protein [Helianthus annuus]|nr:putative rmlC-like jelly roll, cyclic nucleotide-binding protein [Helianthus annuus]KAJ0752563.1 putative rmlC-like jelly roll, cyclic nucleotide-binding protein [Helianthus annuus]